MERNYYARVHNFCYSGSWRYTMVSEREYPTYASGWSKIGTKNGHAWVIDGSAIGVRYQYLVNEDRPNENTGHSEKYSFIHCNMGWGGQCDGYYYEDLFDLRKGTPVSDFPNVPGKDISREYNYSDNKRIITYTGWLDISVYTDN